VSGFKDRIGADRKWWGYFTEVAFEVMEKYNFFQMHPSSVEFTTLYTRSFGKDHPLVEGNLLSVIDPRGEHLSLRPSFDVSYLRAYYLHHKQNFENGIPIENWYTIGSVFGHHFEPREQMQLFMGVIGNEHPVVDAECAVAAYRYIQALGFKNIHVHVNSIGGKQSQTMYRQELNAFYKDRKRQVCETCQPYVHRNPMQLLACERHECKTLRQEAPQSVDWFTDEDKSHFMRVLEYLDELQVPYTLSPEIIPPLDEYMQKTVFSIKVALDNGTIIELARGGRFDGLSVIEQKDIPAMKTVIFLDNCLKAVRQQNMPLPAERLPQVFLAQLGDEAKKKCLAMREELHMAGIKTVEHFGKDSLKDQLEQAMKLGVKYTCVLGQKEILDKTIMIRDMDGGIQEEIPMDKLVPELKKRLGLI
jgi:histidyl-tRNA synthetase